MGQIVTFPVPPTPYPDLAAELDTAECVLLIAIRSWVECHREDEDPIPRLCRGLETAGAPDAAFPIDSLMTLVARSLTRQIKIHCPRCPDLSLDEKNLLLAASLAQAGDRRLAEKVLRTTLLSNQGAEFALGSLNSLSELFTEASLFLSRRRIPVGDKREAWSPTGTVH